MSDSRSIVVGVDFSESSQRALDQALVLAGALDAEVTLLYSWNPSVWNPAMLDVPDQATAEQAWLNQARETAERELARWTERARRSGVRARDTIEAGAASRSLAEASRHCDLIVVGRSGRGGLEHVILGSVSERVVRTAHCPVLVVPGDTAAPHLQPRRLLVGIDFSDPARKALRFSRDLAGELGVRDLVALHVSADERELWLASWSETSRQAEWPYDDEFLTDWVEKTLGDRSSIVQSRVARGHAETQIVEVAKRRECDWIVVGVQGRTALASMLLGSTTDRVLKLADRPVLVVPLGEAPPSEATD